MQLCKLTLFLIIFRTILQLDKKILANWVKFAKFAKIYSFQNFVSYSSTVINSIILVHRHNSLDGESRT